ncbi:MAG: undecaprenyl-phosphate glucose phosphotransferase [Rhodoferax sp.]|jgi:putative colanic acid biosynthesis UDP-glucose lipid carrier transferase|nr:undecaprenyl-phosphate glucose phosphotransferase [Rhodoferax sp.]MBP9147235.1 undecaprenyl-phosphate glucose phosphotransferase [Rhodoferax sp.]
MSKFAVRSGASTPATMVQLLDLLAVFAGGWIAYQIRHFGPEGIADLRSVDLFLIVIMSLFSGLVFGKVYHLWAGGSLGAMLGRVTFGWLIAWMLLIVLLAMTKSAESFSRIWLVTWLGVSGLLLWTGRVAAFLVMARMRSAGYNHKTVVLYGDTDMLQAVRERIERATWSGYDIVATVVQGDGIDLEELNARLKPDEVWISLSLTDQNQLDEVMYSLRNSIANIRLLPDLMMYQILNHGMSVTVGIPMIDISVSPIFGNRQLIKATLDYTVATLALILLSPLMLLIALAIKLTSSGPVLFKQKRHGWNDEEIWVYKFRSMMVHQESDGAVTQAQRHDPRVTALGRFLRRTSLDELPQFINVLQGHMSVVGPRPHALQHNQQYKVLIPKYALRHKVKPGITGWAQVCGFRGETDTLEKMEQRIQHDLYYLENWSIWLDIRIILITPFASLLNNNVY